MDNLIEKIKVKGAQISEKRQLFFNKLKDLQKTLSEAMGEISIYAQSKNVDLDMIGCDDWIYGHLFYRDGVLKIAYRGTEDDFTDSMNGIPELFPTYSVNDLAQSKIEWLEKLSSEESITSLLTSVDKALDDVYEISNKSIDSLDKALDFQSNTISEGMLQVLKGLSDDNLHRQWLKARSQILIDSSDSITRTSSYLESVCHKILTDLSEPLPNNKDITNLINAVVKAITLTENHDAQVCFKQLFSGIKSIFMSIGTLRTHFGIAHGSSSGTYKLDEHCARLVNDAAATVSIFLIKRFEQKLEERK